MIAQRKDRERNKGREGENEEMKGRKRERKKGNPDASHMALWRPLFCVCLQIAPSLISPTRVVFRKAKAVSAYRLCDSKFRIAAFLGLALAGLSNPEAEALRIPALDDALLARRSYS